MGLTNRRRASLIVGLFIVVVGVVLIVGVPSRGGDTEPAPAATEPADDPFLADLGAVVGQPAPEIGGLEAWINSEPLLLEELRGKVVLVDFWTYTCINCVRTFPFLTAWHERYADDGLVIIGVHTPEFEFEKNLGNVRAAAGRHGLEYPIALDNNRVTWSTFRNVYWPRKYLIDKEGVVRYDHAGEGAYEQTESWIQRLLAETGAEVADVAKVEDPDPGAVSLYRLLTPELYAGIRGYFSGHIGNVDDYVNNVRGEDGQRSLEPEAAYYGLPERLERNQIYVEGQWIAREESIRHARTTERFEDRVVLRYRATSVNLVIRPEGAVPFEVELTLDGEPLNVLMKGTDVTIGEDGRSIVVVEQPRVYNLVNAPEFGSHLMTISAKSDAFAFFAFTFGVTPEA